MKTQFFIPVPGTCEELKTMYRKLAMRHHPDCGGDAEAMKTINNEYEVLFMQLKDVHHTKDGETYTSKTPSNEAPEEFIWIIDKLIRFDGITIEIIGCFVWVSGNTKEYKESLKEMRFRWSANKVAWYLAPENYRKIGKRRFELDEIRNMFGSTEIETQPYAKLYA